MEQVGIEFFIQVNEDMLLDLDCVEKLIVYIDPDVGVVTGHLLDPLLGPIIGVSLFRTACVIKFPYQDTIGCETDFTKTIEKESWKVQNLNNKNKIPPKQYKTVGYHLPDYSPRYTFEKFSREGRKLRYRNKPGAFYSWLHKLKNSLHDSAIFAQVGICQGIYLPHENDILQPSDQSPLNECYESLLEFVKTSDQYIGTAKFKNFLSDINFSRFANPSRTFRLSCKLGNQIRREGTFKDFEKILGALWKNEQPYSWIGCVGLCHGIFQEVDEQSTKIFMEFYQGDWIEGRSLRALWKKVWVRIHGLLS